MSGMTSDHDESAAAAPASAETAPAASADAAPAAGQPPPNPEAAKHSVTGAIFHGLLDVLGGKSETSYARDPNTGKMVATEVPKTPGQQWATLASSILAGAAAGAQTNRPGAPALAGLAAGGDAAMKQAGARDATKRQQASEDLNEQQKAQLQKAQMAKMNQDLTDHAWDASQKKVDASQHQASIENDIGKSVMAGGAGSQDLGVHRDIDDVIKTSKNNPAAMQAHIKDGTLMSVPHVDPATNKIDGIHYWIATPDYAKAKTTTDQTFRRMIPGDKPGDQPKFEEHTVPAGSMSNGEFMLAQHAAADDMLKMQIAQQTEKQKAADAGAVTDKERFHESQETARKQMEISGGSSAKGKDGQWDQSSIPVSLVEGNMDPSQLTKRGKDYNAKLQEANKYSLEKYGKPFDIAQATTDYKFANRGTTQDMLKMVGAMTSSKGELAIAVNAAKDLPALNSSLVNKVFGTVETQFGSDKITNFHTAMTGFSDLYAKVMGGGTGTDSLRQSALDVLKDGYSKGQLAGSINILRQQIEARRDQIVGENRYLKKQFGGAAGGGEKFDPSKFPDAK